MSKIEIICKNTGIRKEYPLGITLSEIAKDQGVQLKDEILAARVNNSLRELSFEIFKPKTVEFIDIHDPMGYAMYMRSMIFIMFKAARDLWPESTLKVEHTLPLGTYCELIGIQNLVEDTFLRDSVVQYIVALSGAIFSQAQALGLFEKEAGLDELLSYGAKLHDVGIAISYDKHYQHGAYLVRFCPLLGFTQKEVLTIARLVYLHSRPSSDLPGFLSGDALTEAQKWAAVSLFMAENLDRTHRSMVRNVKLAVNNRDLVLDVELKEASPLETASVEKIKKQVKKLLGRNIEVRFEIADRHIELVHD